jgi:hypothetical protein
MSEEPKKRYLTKTLYTCGSNCMKALWLKINKPEELVYTEEARGNMSHGTQLGQLAWQLFPGGTEIEFVKGEYDRMVAETRELIDSGAKTIYEATFCHDNILVRVDILHLGDDGWEIHEVKSAHSVKPSHLDDLAVQYYVVAGSGIKLKKATLIHVDGAAKRRGEVEAAKLLSISDQTAEAISRQAAIPIQAGRMSEVITEDEPAIAMGSQCDKPFRCDFYGYCL